MCVGRSPWQSGDPPGRGHPESGHVATAFWMNEVDSTERPLESRGPRQVPPADVRSVTVSPRHL